MIYFYFYLRVVLIATRGASCDGGACSEFNFNFCFVSSCRETGRGGGERLDRPLVFPTSFPLFRSLCFFFMFLFIFVFNFVCACVFVFFFCYVPLFLRRLFPLLWFILFDSSIPWNPPIVLALPLSFWCFIPLLDERNAYAGQTPPLEKMPLLDKQTPLMGLTPPLVERHPRVGSSETTWDGWTSGPSWRARCNAWLATSASSARQRHR